MAATQPESEGDPHDINILLARRLQTGVHIRTYIIYPILIHVHA